MPYLSLPYLHGALYAAGFDATLLDLNLEFHYWLFSSEGMTSLQNCITQRLMQFNSKRRLNQKEIDICRQLFQAAAAVKSLQLKIDSVIKILKSDDFYQPNSLIQTFNLICEAYEITSAAYAPSEINFISFDSPYDCTTPEGLAAAVADQEVNLYLNYFKNVTLPYIADLSPRMIGISICSETQWLPALTLCYALRQSGFNGNIVLGGGIPSRLASQLENPETSLSDYCDIIAIGEGEEIIVKIADTLSNGGCWEEVPNIIWYSGKKAFVSHYKAPDSYRNLPPPKFDGLPLNRYLSPKSVLPVMVARGCYNQCAFCDHSTIYGRKRSVKGIKQIVGELKSLYSNYNVSNFAFSDEVLPPKTAIKLCDALIKEGLRLNMASCFCLEKGWSKDVWNRLVDTGFLLGQFGLESASDRILLAMNKRSCSTIVMEILESACEAGLWNHIFLMFGFPGETEEDAYETINFVKKHTDKIHSVGASRFHLMRHAPIYKQFEQFSLSYNKVNPWSLVIPYETRNGLSPESADDIKDRFQKTVASNMNGVFLWQRLERSQLLLYLSRYGRDKVLEMGSVLCDGYQSQDSEPYFPIDIHLQWFQHDVTLDVNYTQDIENNLPVDKKGFPFFTVAQSRSVLLLNDEAAWIVSAWCEGRPVDYIAEQLHKRLGCSKMSLYKECRDFIASQKLYLSDKADEETLDPDIGIVDNSLRQQIETFIRQIQAPTLLPVGALPEWIAVTKGLKPGLRTVLYQMDKTSISALTDELRRRGMHVRYRPAPGDGFVHLSPKEREIALKANPIIVYIAKSSKRAENLYRAEDKGSQVLGQVLGYPDCCISWLVELDRQTLHEKRPCNFPIMSAKNTNGKFAAELNNLLWYIPTLESPLYLISHYPCSYDCIASIKQAHQLYAIIHDLCPEFAATLKEILSRPILLWDDTWLPEHKWDENKGMVFEGIIDKNKITYESYISLRRPRKYTELAIAFSDEIVILPDRVYTICKNRMAGCWWNFEQGQPYILNFNVPFSKKI